MRTINQGSQKTFDPKIHCVILENVDGVNKLTVKNRTDLTPDMKIESGRFEVKHDGVDWFVKPVDMQ